MRISLPAILLLMLTSLPAFSQDLESIGKARPLDFSGSLSLRLNSYSTSRQNNIRDPFFWTLSGSPTISLYGVTMPFYFSFSQKNRDFRQPFNQFGVSPYYKWLRLHLGYRNISFSDFTLSNHTFLGVGVEAEPSVFRFGFVYGRFLKAIDQPLDTLAGEIITPTLARKGMALKVGVGTYNNYVDLIFFKGKDDSTSVTTPMSLAEVSAAENVVYGIKARQAFLKMFYFDIDYGFSIYSSDVTAAEVNTEEYKVPGFVSSMITPRLSTTFLMAGKASLSMRLKALMLKVQYTRVEPDYQSMGSYFLNNDYENITIAPSWSMWKSKVRINASLGIQRNNLFDDKLSKTNRNINSVNVTFSPDPKFNLNVFYTNYRINQERNSRLTLDTLKLEQFSDNLNVSSALNLGTKEIRHAIQGNINYQAFRDDTSCGETNRETSSVNPMLGYRYQNTITHFGLAASINLNQFSTPENETTRWGFTAGASKNLSDNKLRFNGSATYYTITVDDAGNSNAMSFSGRAAYTVKDRHALSFAVQYVTRMVAGDEGRAIRDILTNFGYTYSFGRN